MMIAEQHKLLIVEDDERLAELISGYFSRAGFSVRALSQGQQAKHECTDFNPSVVILDLMLPDTDGISVCRELRTFYQGRILVLTASGSDIDQVVCFEMGADDYVTKPVEPRVLLARINALLRRGPMLEANEVHHTLQFGGLMIDDEAKTVTLDGVTVPLTTHEYELLSLLAENAGSVLTRDEIYSRLRGIGYDGSDRAVDVKISRLRKKLQDDGHEPQRIKTIWGKGYLLVPSAW
ncbi:winged helix-turn-helix domain-containing protein [Marinicella sp. W31]|uniref:winged helix-turn-helix domain-containing protein n=1 Tax=Marinicella sp. W31 TaxID=3023713 RepID=UPI0037584D4B